MEHHLLKLNPSSVPLAPKEIKRIERRRGQASLEYFIVVSLALIILTPIIALSHKTSLDMEEFRNSLTLKQSLESIENAANLVYAQGEPSSVVISVMIPEKVVKLECGDTYIGFRLSTVYGYNDYLVIFPFNITCSFPLLHGKFKLRMRAQGGRVIIEKYS